MLKFTRETFLPSTIDYVLSSILRHLRADTYDELKYIDTQIAANGAEVDILQEQTESIDDQFSGFTNQKNIVVTYNEAAGTITLTGTFVAYYKMRIVAELIDGWTSPPHPAGYTTGAVLYYDGTDFVWATGYFPHTPATLIAYVYFRSDGSFLFANRETHGLMPIECHWEDHFSIGARKQSGGVLTNFTPASTTAAQRRPDIGQMVLADEDLWTTNAAWLKAAGYTQAYLQSAGTITSVEDAAEIVPVLSARPYVNIYTGGAWTQKLIDNNNYMCVWVMAMPVTADVKSQKRRFFFVQGQSEGTLVAQQALIPNNVNIGALASIGKEIIFIAKIIIRYTALDWTITSISELTGTQATMISVAVDSGLQSHIDTTTSVHGSTSAATASKIVERDANGRAQIVDPSVDADIATKKYIDDQLALYRVGRIEYRMVIPANALELNGALVNRADYPVLWAYANNNSLTVTEAAWAAGAVGSYSVGNGSTTFRLPDFRGMFIRAAGTNSVMKAADGSYFVGGVIMSVANDQMQALTGSAAIIRMDTGTKDGVFKDTTQTASGSTTGSANRAGTLDFKSANSPNARTGIETAPARISLYAVVITS